MPGPAGYGLLGCDKCGKTYAYGCPHKCVGGKVVPCRRAKYHKNHPGGPFGLPHRTATETQVEVAKCSRKGCTNTLDEHNWYNVADGYWARFGKAGETKVCDECMKANKDFAALYGRLT